MPKRNKDKDLLDARHGGDIGNLFKSELIKEFNKIPLSDSSYWEEKPVGVGEFASEYIGIPLYPEQLILCEAIFGTKPLIWDSTFKHFVVLWGKGAGKDWTVAIAFDYGSYKINCMRNPSKFFDNDSFDLVNVSVNARQAKNVFFKKLSKIFRATKNPKTKKNWYEERGADFRRHEDIQTIEINLPKDVTCHSLNSVSFTGEGLNLIMAVNDEKGGQKGGKGVELTDTLTETIDSRNPKYGKMLDISFLYHLNDDMDITYKKAIAHSTVNQKYVYVTRKATWEVNPKKNKSDYKEQYNKNKARAMRTYECKGGDIGGGAIPNKQLILNSYKLSEVRNPTRDKVSSTRDLFSIRFWDWFRGDPTKLYVVGIDLAKGKETGDDAGLALGHPELMLPKLNKQTEFEWSDEEIKDFEKQERKGVIIDFMMQIKAPDMSTEVRLSEIRRFVVKRLVNQLGFNVVAVRYDGYESLESIQEFNAAGIEAERNSVDKTNDPYESWIDSLGEQLFKTYRNMVYKREAIELIRDEETGKIDHPALSYDRKQTENKDKGSKDVTDAVVQVHEKAMTDIAVDGVVHM